MEKKERICLIIPPSVFLLDERVFMSLGILKVAAVLEKQYKVEVIDLSGVKNFEDVIRDYAYLSDTLVFGLTATTPQMPAVTKIIKAIRETKLQVKIILGGPHGTLVNAAYRQEHLKNIKGRANKSFFDLLEMFDVVIAGDGEESIFEALKPNAPKLIDADNSQSELFLTSNKLSGYPLPARHLIDVNSYHYSIDNERALSLIAQLGCPYNCGFCGGRKSPSFRKARTRPVKNIIEEITHLYERYGVKGFMFYDDELNVNRKLMVDLMNSLIALQDKLGTEFRLRGFVRTNLFDDEQAEALYRAGFRWLLIGFESGSSRMLRNMNKRVTREENTQCLETARRHGLKVKALMSIGHPAESEKTIMETHKWLSEVKPDDFDVTIITVYPGTPYYDEAVPHPTKAGIWVYTYDNDRLYSEEIDYKVAADYYKGDPDGGYKSYVYTDFLTAEEIVSFRGFVERDVREKLGIPFNPSASARTYEHSMGAFPPYILKRSSD
jgi:radical SAM superfamily enzyme YgiQ (UPF0313 family)